jgi:hypothetical protein
MLEIIINIALFIITLTIIISFFITGESDSEYPLSKRNNATPEADTDSANAPTLAHTEPEQVNENFTPTEYSKFSFNSYYLPYLIFAAFACAGCVLGFIAQVFMDNSRLGGKAAIFTLLCLFGIFGLWRGFVKRPFWWLGK